MKQRLFKTEDETVFYDDATGEATGPADRAAKPNGTCYSAGDALVALYVCEGNLCLQVGDVRFWIGDQALQCHYENDWQRGQTRVEFADASSKVELEYPGWWVEQGLSVADAQAMPDQACVADGLAALYQVIDDPDWRLRVLSNWGDADPSLMEPLVDSVVEDVAAALADEAVSDELVAALAAEVLGEDSPEGLIHDLLGDAEAPEKAQPTPDEDEVQSGEEAHLRSAAPVAGGDDAAEKPARAHALRG